MRCCFDFWNCDPPHGWKLRTGQSRIGSVTTDFYQWKNKPHHSTDKNKFFCYRRLFLQSNVLPSYASTTSSNRQQRLRAIAAESAAESDTYTLSREAHVNIFSPSLSHTHTWKHCYSEIRVNYRTRTHVIALVRSLSIDCWLRTLRT